MTKPTENREMFIGRVDYMSPSDVAMIEDSYDLGKATHKKQVRKELDENGVPKRYWEHCRRVGLIVIDELHITYAPLICLTLTHDVFEDADPRAHVSPERFERRFGPVMTQRLQLISKKRPPENATPEERKALKEEYIFRLFNYADLIVLLAKGGDRLDNLRSLWCDGVALEFVRRQCEETRKDYIPLFAKMEVMARGTEFHDAALKLRILIHEELVRCETRLKSRESPLILGEARSLDDDNAFGGEHDEDDSVPADHD